MKTNLYVLHVKGRGYLKSIIGFERVEWAKTAVEGKHLSERMALEVMTPLQILYGSDNVKMQTLGTKRV